MESYHGSSAPSRIEIDEEIKTVLKGLKLIEQVTEFADMALFTLVWARCTPVIGPAGPRVHSHVHPQWFGLVYSGSGPLG
jgi:hypothetical protein